MDSVPFLSSLIAVVWLVLWFFRSDKRPANEPMIGVFALRQTARQKATKAKVGARPTPVASEAAAAAPAADAPRQDHRSGAVRPRGGRRD